MSRARWVETRLQIPRLTQQPSPGQEATIYQAFHQIVCTATLDCWCASACLYTLTCYTGKKKTPPCPPHKFSLFPSRTFPLHKPPLQVHRGWSHSPWQPSQVGGGVHNARGSPLLHHRRPPSVLTIMPPELVSSTPQRSLPNWLSFFFFFYFFFVFSPLPPELSLPQLLPPGLAQSFEEASQLPLLLPAVKKEKQA